MTNPLTKEATRAILGALIVLAAGLIGFGLGRLGGDPVDRTSVIEAKADRAIDIALEAKAKADSVAGRQAAIEEWLFAPATGEEER